MVTNIELVSKSIDNRKEHLGKDRVRLFAARARAYIYTYHYLATKHRPTDDPEKPNEDGILLFDEIERLSKSFSSHRSAFDFDKGFLLVKNEGGDGKDTSAGNR